MHTSMTHFSKKDRMTILFAVTSGNLLEWYEIYLFTYWAPTIAKLFFSPELGYSNLFHAFLLFFLGFLARPIGGIYFGRLGDRIGRKKALIISILIMVIPTFLIGLLPTFEDIGYFSTVLLALLRIIQSFPAGGEVPGAACYLYESSPYSDRKYMTSWTAVGVQIGILIATLETFFLHYLLDPRDTLKWGWRVSFLIGGAIGVFGLLLRSKLQESPLFKELHNNDKRHIPKPLLKVINLNRMGIIKTILFCFLSSPAFYFISVNFSSYFKLGVNELIVTAFFLLLVTLPVPLFGKIANRYKLKSMLILSAFIILIVLFPLYYSANNQLFGLFLFSAIVFCLCVACITALTPYLVCDLFPTRVRFTGVAMGYNFVDAIIGGMTPAATLILLEKTGDKGSFCIILLICSLVSFISFFFIKDRHSAPLQK